MSGTMRPHLRPRPGLAPLTGGLANLSTAPASPQGLYVLPGFSTAAAPITQNAGITTATGASSYHVASLPGDYYNSEAQGIYNVGPSERYGLYTRVTNELTSDITFTFDALYNRRLSSQLFSPTSLSIGGTSGTEKGYAIAANQQYNPFGVGFTPTQAWSIGIFTNAVGDRTNIEDDDNYHFSAGLDGTLGVLGPRPQLDSVQAPIPANLLRPGYLHNRVLEHLE